MKCLMDLGYNAEPDAALELLLPAISLSGARALFIALTALSLPTAMAEPCPGSTTPEVEACLAQQLDTSDARLQRYVDAARKRIAAGDPRETPHEFEAAQTAWIAYRRAECGAVFEAWREGTIRVSMELECERRLTDHRTHEIWRDWLTFVDREPPLLPEPPMQTGK